MARILVVDDDRSIQLGLSALLSGQRHEVVCGDGIRAMDCLRTSEFDLVITDLFMPQVNGLDILKEARRKRPETAVMIMTAYGALDPVMEAMALGACDVVQKPYGLEELEVRIGRALGRQALCRENAALRLQLEATSAQLEMALQRGRAHELARRHKVPHPRFPKVGKTTSGRLDRYARSGKASSA